MTSQRIAFFSLVFTVLSVTSFESVFGAQYIDGGLKAFWSSSEASQPSSQSVNQPVAKIIVLMATNSSKDATKNLQTAPARYDRQGVVNYLKFISQKQWLNIDRAIQSQAGMQKNIKVLEGYFLNVSFSAMVTPAGLRFLAGLPEVHKIYMDRKVAFQKTKVSPVLSGYEAQPLPPYNFKDVGMDQVLSQFPDVTGQGVVLGVMDTGVDGKHVALKGKVLDFFDAHSKTHTEPTDSQGHGTHVCGTVAGGDRSNGENQFIGIAPQAKLIVAAGLDSEGDLYTNMLSAMQYFLDQSQNPSPSTPHAGPKFFPRAVNNSWHAPGAPDLELFYRAIEAWEAAGILPVFAAGNSGCSAAGQTIGNPQTHPLAFAVAATESSGLATSFSSCGPGIYHGEKTNKPEISAPGNKIRSSIPGGGYKEMSGTSMASPHVTAAAGLLFQINPKLTPPQVREILMRSAKPLAETGQTGVSGVWNRVYGYGKLNLLDAVKITKAMLGQGFFGSNRLGLLAPLDLDAAWIGKNTTQVRFAFSEKH